MVEAAVDALARVAPVLVFLVAVTVLAELCEAAGIFDATARAASVVGRGRTPALFLLVVALATVCTIALSLDTTAVLLTPAVLATCTRLNLDPVPFAMATVWLANTTSLLLPVSNLTNLLALEPLGLSTREFAGRMWAPTLAALAMTTAVLVLLYGRRLRGRYVVPRAPEITDRPLFVVCAAACAGFVILILAGIDVTAAACTGAAVPLIAFAVRRPAALAWSLIPWRLVLLVAGLFVVVAAARRGGLDELIGVVAGLGSAPADLLRLALSAAAGANAVNNLPAYLALEPAVIGSEDRLLALLIGVNAGPLLLVWGSLATLLWRERCRARGVHISAGRFALAGLVACPAVVLVAVSSLQLT